MTVLIVGSVALDSIETPHGKAERTLGGSASYASLASRLFAPTAILGVVGADFPREHVEMLTQMGVDTLGLLTVPDGKTFHWSGRYHADMNTRDTLVTELNVLATHHPDVPEALRSAEFVFLANTDPELQLQTLSRCTGCRFVLADTMNLWIALKREAVWRLISKADVMLINDSEARELCETSNLVKAAHRVLDAGARRVIIKKGEHGSMMFSPGGVFVAPGFPLEQVCDPTGAGDTFAGAYIGSLAACKKIDEEAHRRAVIAGTAAAAFDCESFGVDRLRRLSREELMARCREIKDLMHFAGDGS